MIAVQKLEESHFIDLQTRALLVVFNVYNPNFNLFASIQHVLDFLPSGAVVPTLHVNVVPIDIYNDPVSRAIAAVEVIMACIILYIIGFHFRYFAIIYEIEFQRRLDASKANTGSGSASINMSTTGTYDGSDNARAVSEGGYKDEGAKDAGEDGRSKYKEEELRKRDRELKEAHTKAAECFYPLLYSYCTEIWVTFDIILVMSFFAANLLRLLMYLHPKRSVSFLYLDVMPVWRYLFRCVRGRLPTCNNMALRCFH